MYETVVAIDLETSGVDPYSDKIIEVGAVIYRDGEVVDRFSELVRAGVPLRQEIIKLTGITPKMLEEARSADEVLADFLEWLPDDVHCIAHNAAFDRSFLRVATKDAFKNVVIDTVGLSRVCFPEFESHSLEVLKELFGLPEGESHRALADCETLVQVWDRIIEQSRKIPLAVVGEINYLIAGINHPYREFFRWLESEALTEGFGRQSTNLTDVFKERIVGKVRVAFEEDDEPAKKLKIEDIENIFAGGGAFDRKLDSYEFREGQQRMAVEVAQSFNREKHLLVEAGTGIGKSLAYLVPAVLWATENNSPVIVSTNTKNLQSQLFDKDIPLLREVLGINFKAALIKGRRNYLCIRKLLYVLRQANSELDREDRMRMMNILPWAAWSSTGDISENIVSGRPGFGELWSKLSTVGDECLGNKCQHQKNCFLRRARARSLDADVVVANHSLVFAEMNKKSPAIPPYSRIVFDEAHNLEEAATRHLSVEMSLPRVRFAMNRVYRPGKRGKGTGLAVSIMNQLESAVVGADKELVELSSRNAYKLIGAVEATEAPALVFFDDLESVLRSRKSDGPLRFWNENKRESVWNPVISAKKDMVSAFADVMRAAEALCDNLKEFGPDEVQYLPEFIRDLEASVQWVKEISEDFEFVLEGADEGYVFWLEQAMHKHGGVRGWAAPKVIGPLLFDQVYQSKKTVIFSSATMSVRGNFDFIKKRIGLDLMEKNRLTELDAGTPFDYEKQCLVAAPVFLPEPGEAGKDYNKQLSTLMAEVFRRTQGRGMVLFTSYKMLQVVAEDLQKELFGDGINILSQGSSGSRESITSIFKRDIHSVLLGTHSFWEGVDVVGEALSCLAIARLPFQVFTDPVVEARCEQVEADGGNAFLGYSVPNAVVRFKQGFGRLIRHKSDVGLVIIADRRIVTKRYGKWFQDSLPCRTEVFSDREEFLSAVEEFFPECK